MTKPCWGVMGIRAACRAANRVFSFPPGEVALERLYLVRVWVKGS